jgi:hypothetical protein
VQREKEQTEIVRCGECQTLQAKSLFCLVCGSAKLVEVGNELPFFRPMGAPDRATRTAST